MGASLDDGSAVALSGARPLRPLIRVGGPRPRVEPEERLERLTASLCPECLRIIPAALVERGGKILVRKTCPDHGEFEDVYYGDSQLYRRFLRFEEEGRGTVKYVDSTAPCPFSCGLCDMHRNHTALLNIVVTNRCPLSCWYCFFYAEQAGFVYEPSIEQIRGFARSALRQGRALAVQLTGGEPLLRDDLAEIVRALKEEGVRHVQLNIAGVSVAELYLRSPELAVEWVRELREAGVNTVYLSFDGTTPKTNPKNHWEVPFIFETFRRAGMTSVVLVPTVIRGFNDHALGDILKFAARNMDLVRGVNFQPISFTGRMRRQELEASRVTVADVIRLVEEQTDGQIGRESWYPCPAAAKIAKFVEALTGREQFLMANHVACGAATYVFVERSSGSVVFRPLTEYFDVDGFLAHLDEAREKLEGSGRIAKALRALSTVASLRRFVKRDALPNGESLTRLLIDIFTKRSYDALGRLHYSALFLGIMHFMDLYNYDVQRVMRCNIHYASPDGRIIPFCTYNVLNEIYRDSVFKEFGAPMSSWRGRPHRYGVSEKYSRDLRALTSHPLYRVTYEGFI
ncbi:MAG: radical SAM protein [Fervidicoccaceae archaeon]